MNVTLRQLQAFLAVAATGSFTRAAERLGLTQPGVSVLVRELEAELGLRLLDRSTRRVEPTASGAEFLAQAEKIVADLEGAVRGMRDVAARRRGRIALAAPPLLSAALMPAVLARAGEALPGVAATLADLRTDQIVERVAAGTADIGIGTFPPVAGEIGRVPLMQDALMLFTPRASAPAGEVPWDRLDAMPVIALTRDSGIRLLVDGVMEGRGLGLRPALEATQISTALALVAAGLGAAILPALALAIADRTRLAATPLVDPVVSREVVAITRAGRALPPAGPAVLELLREEAATLAASLAVHQPGANLR
ncbi:LysR family transcriptional regulator [Arenibaculum pallidiluteum]|uniref:LysR family transcriptional regulator n=1 Tax=Arenibaculum pallidiluteum TaxID=2812559 RepID=UPI001A9593BB|nr:LysR family transcriptional regulator [Arenibaculum pallidiluteum]